MLKVEAVEDLLEITQLQSLEPARWLQDPIGEAEGLQAWLESGEHHKGIGKEERGDDGDGERIPATLDEGAQWRIWACLAAHHGWCVTRARS